MRTRNFAILASASLWLAAGVARAQPPASPRPSTPPNAPGVTLVAADDGAPHQETPAMIHVDDNGDGPVFVDAHDRGAAANDSAPHVRGGPHTDHDLPAKQRDQQSVLVRGAAPAELPGLTPPQTSDARLTDEEIALIRRWTRRLARHEDRSVLATEFAQDDPFADDPTAPQDGSPPNGAPRPFDWQAETDSMNPTADPPSSGQSANGQSANGQAANGQAANGSSAQRPRGFDPAVVAAGRAAFDAACTACHDAERSTSVRKSLGGWMATVRRMAGKEGADIPPSDVQPIATYLASLNPAATAESAGDGSAASAIAESSWSVFSTVSLIHRSGTREEIENQGFFPEVWLGAEWHPAGPLSGRVNVCVTCHTENASVSNRIELAEGFFRLDAMRLMGCEDPACQPFQFHIDAGRFIVPFGAFAAQSHPGAFRTATRPLMYNMGQNVYRDELPAPLLPMPYSDEGLLASATLPLFAEVNATLDFYAVNGLQGSTGLDLPSWYQSRDYVDNNTEPAVGGRATIGNRYLRAGASLMSGRFNENRLQAAVPETLDYKIYGADLVARYEDWVRIQVEWARRDNDAFDFLSAEVGRESTRGTVIEGEFKLWDKPRVSALVRYDDQLRTDGPPRFGTPIVTPEVSVRRFTYGLNFAIGSSTLMINHERWKVPDPLNDLDILAIRWVAAF